VHSAAAAAEKTAAATAVLYMAAALHTAAAEMAAAEMAADSEEYHNSFHSNAPHTRKKSACHYVVTCLLQAPYISVASNRYRSTSTHSCVISSRLLARALRLRRFVRQPFHSETSRLANRSILKPHDWPTVCIDIVRTERSERYCKKQQIPGGHFFLIKELGDLSFSVYAIFCEMNARVRKKTRSTRMNTTKRATPPLYRRERVL
jgi:hypothetical protein